MVLRFDQHGSEMSIRDLHGAGGKAQPALKADTMLPPSLSSLSRQCGILNMSQLYSLHGLLWGELYSLYVDDVRTSQEARSVTERALLFPCR
jgi:hypothetical protein